MIRLQEQLAGKSRELQQQQLSAKDLTVVEPFELKKPAPDESTLRKLKQLQQELIEVRASHTAELESVKLDVELELAEEKKALLEHRLETEKRFSPGTAPGEILEQNHQLLEKVAHMQQTEADLGHENESLFKRCEELQHANEELAGELDDCKRALVEIEGALISQPVSAPSSRQHAVQSEQDLLKSSGAKSSAKHSHAKMTSKDF